MRHNVSCPIAQNRDQHFLNLVPFFHVSSLLASKIELPAYWTRVLEWQEIGEIL